MNTLSNSVNLIGRLGKEVEIKEISSGNKVANILIATNDFYKNNKGELMKETQWHNLVAWGKTAELMSNVLSKGNEVAIQGKLVHRTYEDKEGNQRYVSEVKVNDFLKVSRVEKEPAPF